MPLNGWQKTVQGNVQVSMNTTQCDVLIILNQVVDHIYVSTVYKYKLQRLCIFMKISHWEDSYHGMSMEDIDTDISTDCKLWSGCPCCRALFRVPTHPWILEKFLNFILKVQGLEIYLNFVKNPGILIKIFEKKCCQLNMVLFWWNFA